MKSLLRLTLLLTLLATAFGQEPAPSGLRPFVDVGANLNGGGYDVFAVHGGGGVRIDSTHFLLETEVSADNARKQGFKSGHDLYAHAETFYRFTDGWYLGGGWQWSEGVTPDYKKHQFAVLEGLDLYA